MPVVPVVLVDKAVLVDKVELEEMVTTQHMLELLVVLLLLFTQIGTQLVHVKVEDTYLTVKVHLVPYTLVITLVTNK